MHTVGRIATVAAVGLLGLLIGGCSGSTPGGPTVTAAAPDSFNALTDPEQVPVIAREELGENPRVRRIHLYETGFMMQVRDPDKPENLDDYRYDGQEWTADPVSVSVREIDEYDQTTFGLGAVNWAEVPVLMDKALAGLDLEEEEISSVSFDKLAGEPPRVYIGVQGLRGNGHLIARADGTRVVVTRN